MRSLRVYLDTSVLGGVFDEEFFKDTQVLLDAIKAKSIIPVVSDGVRTEVALAPHEVRSLLAELEARGAEVLVLSVEADRLTSAYLKAGVVSPRFRNDATHITLTTVAKVDVSVSWNFKRVVKLPRILGFDGVNLLYGISPSRQGIRRRS